MSERSGSLARGRRHADETPDPPATESLNPQDAEAQRVLRRLVERAEGRLPVQSRGAVPVGDLGVLAPYVERWAIRISHQTASGRVYSGRPGAWHAFDELYPLQDPNRWDALRAAVFDELQTRHGWQRDTPPHRTAWRIPRSAG